MTYKLILNFLLLITPAFADGIGQSVPGQVTESPYEDGSINGETPFLNEAISQEYIGSKNSSAETDITNSQNINDEWLKRYKTADKKLENSGEYLEFSNKVLAKDLYQKSSRALTFTYLYDSFTYSDRNNIFNETFKNKDSKKSIQGGYALLMYSKYISRGTVDFFWKSGAGISFNTGRGKFADDGTLSKTRFNFWNFPLELSLGAKLNIGRHFGLSASGGGMLVGAYQSRSDRSEEDEDKEIKQILYGYTAEVALEVSLSQMFPNFSHYLKSNSEVGDLSLAFTAKTIEVSNSKSDQYQISGASFGLGFKFELL